MQVKTAPAEQIFEKKLYFLLPFFIFNYERDLPSCEEDEEKLAHLKGIYTDIQKRLEEAADLKAYDKVVLVEMSQKVLDKIAAKYAKVRKGVGEVMGGKVLYVTGSEYYDAGKEQGRSEGLSKGLSQGLSQGRSEGLLKGKLQTALNLRDMGMTDDFIARAVKESVTLVRQWLSGTPEAAV